MLMQTLFWEKLGRFINPSITSVFHSQVKNLMLSSQLYAPYPNIRAIDKDDITRFPDFKQLVVAIKPLLEKRSNTTADFFKIWLVRNDSTITVPETLPYVLHFDKQRFLKALIYLHDVNLENGPIHFANAKFPEKIEERRVILPKNHKERRLNWVSNDDIYHNPKPILGKGGDLILFDTNTPHHAGLIEVNHSRLVIRIDYLGRSHQNKIKI